MRLTIGQLAKICKTGSSSYKKIYRKSTRKWEIIDSRKNETKINEAIERPHVGISNKNVEEETGNDYRRNEMDIQMLSAQLYEQVFRNCVPKTIEPAAIQSFQRGLRSHGIKIGETAQLANVNVKLPPLRGANLMEHFYEIATEQSQPYRRLVESLVHKDIPTMPKTWRMIEGWTRYNEDGSTSSVPYPDEKALIFDIEVCMREGSAPTIACAVGERCWYSWTSKSLLMPANQSSRERSESNEPRIYNATDMIPMECDGSTEPKLIVGHNVSFDRARIRNQYDLQPTATRFLDTMALHVCVSGVTSFQKAMLVSSKEMNEEDTQWASQSSLNNLVDVFKLYCGASSDDIISKESRSIFVDGTLDDVRKDFHHLMEYCAKDVRATYRVLQKLYPLFNERFPHPATFAGMLELGMAYLPVNSNWFRYIKESDLAYKDFDIESKYLLAKRANQACRLLHDDAFKRDLWLWNEDWSVQEFKLKKESNKKKSKVKTTGDIETQPISETEDIEYHRLERKFRYLFDKKDLLPKRKQFLVGYPAWYRKLCKKTSEPDWQPGPTEIGTGMQIASKLLSLSWEGYPLHHIREHGWGFLVPFTEQTDRETKLPLKQLIKKCPVREFGRDSSVATRTEAEMAFGKLSKDVEQDLGRRDYYSKAKTTPTNRKYAGTGVWCDIELEECCWFYKLPHKDGEKHRVGNPLARDFLIKFSENVLAGENASAVRVIQIARMLSYWRNNRDRVLNQIVVQQNHTQNANDDGQSTLDGDVLSINGSAAIIPQVVTCGTLTRRAMESTWMTASNAQSERIGSELRSMVQAPAGYRIVGADVDSQELWIASVLGDAREAGIHGATPFGWMTLNGTKSNATDMHSVTAKAVGITRDHAKVLNYARIYGAGQTFATRLLKQFNPTITDAEAKSKAQRMFKLTKGQKLFFLRDEYLGEFEQSGYTNYNAKKVCAIYGKKMNEVFMEAKWCGGTESAMFNCLEKIAGMPQPKTPFLDCRLSRALEPQPDTDDRFLPTRINWVVQSGAVDFLHLMLVCMRWLMADNIRFCLSFHDEIRYLVREDLAYKAAVAMHMTNLLTRAFCVMRIGLNDLPQSIAFFTSVEVDRVLRKEAQMDCKTPSNPHGLKAGYGIPLGETLDVQQSIEKARGNDLNEWDWHRQIKVRKYS